MTVVKIKELEKFIKGAIIDEDIFFAMSKAQLQGYECIDIPKQRLDAMERRLSEHLLKEKAISHCAWLNNKGSEFEKAGKLHAAIHCYEQNILPGCYPATHSFERLMIIYRKQNDYENEKRVILRAIEVFPKEIKFQERLKKVELFILKNKQL